MEDEFARQLVAELLETNEQAFVILASTMADITGTHPFATALEQRIATAKASGGHPMTIAMLERVLRSLKAS